MLCAGDVLCIPLTLGKSARPWNSADSLQTAPGCQSPHLLAPAGRSPQGRSPCLLAGTDSPTAPEPAGTAPGPVADPPCSHHQRHPGSLTRRAGRRTPTHPLAPRPRHLLTGSAACSSLAVTLTPTPALAPVAAPGTRGPSAPWSDPSCCTHPPAHTRAHRTESPHLGQSQEGV